MPRAPTVMMCNCAEIVSIGVVTHPPINPWNQNVLICDYHYLSAAVPHSYSRLSSTWIHCIEKRGDQLCFNDLAPIYSWLCESLDTRLCSTLMKTKLNVTSKPRGANKTRIGVPYSQLAEWSVRDTDLSLFYK